VTRSLSGLDPEAVAGELLDFGVRLAQTLPALRAAAGVTAGCSGKEAVWKDGKLVLYRYLPLAKRAPLTPLVIVYALVNRPYMMDLQEDRSLIRRLLELGVDLYLIDWGYPDGADRLTGIEDYLESGVDRCVRQVAERHGVDAVNVLGVCQGGTFSLCYTALHPERVQNLVTMVTPVDFQTPENLLSKWASRIDVDSFVRAHGNIPGELLNAVFVGLLPFRLNQQKYVNLVDAAGDPKQLETFMRMEKWIFDSPDQAGAAFAEFIRWFFQENRLMKGTLEIGGRRVDLGRIRQPLLNIYASQDHLVPPSASMPLAGLTGSVDYTPCAVDAGHIGIYTSGRAQREVPRTIAGWLGKHERQWGKA